MTQALEKDEGEQQMARPLRVLVPLIKEDLEQGKQAADRAGMPYYQAAGEKLIEAKGQMKHGEFVPWVKRNFEVSRTQAWRYMALAEAAEKFPRRNFSTVSEAVRSSSDPTYNTAATKQPAWTPAVKLIVGRVDTETLNLKREELKRHDEREAQRKLALQLIDIGYKVLARALHPDKGGSREAMSRLNAVRERLKQYA